MTSKSMPQKSNHDFTERYPNMKASTFEPMRIKDISIKKPVLPYVSIYEYE